MKIFYQKTLWVLLAYLICLPASANQNTRPNQPNIILILADDVSPDKFSIFEQAAAVNTPNIDKLARQGVAFQTAYATAMCAPSRVQIMTGKYANSTGVYHNDIWLGNSRDKVYSEHDTFAQVVKESGYSTAVVGKWHAGKQMPHEAPLSFDEYALWVSDKYADVLGDTAEFKGLYEDDKTPSRYWQPSYSINGKRLDTKPNDYSLDIEVDFINDFISRKSSTDQPFLVYWPTVAPHGTREGMPTTPFRGKPGEMGKTKKKETQARFNALVEYLDYSVGNVVQHIEKLGIADNTIIIFTSDNGTAVTAKTRGVERGPQVMAVFSGKGVKQRGITSEIMDFTDIAPTLAKIVNNTQTVNFDGKDLTPFLAGETDIHRDWIYGYIAGSQIFRTKSFLLEVVNPILGLPEGRLYFTGDNHFQHGYTRIKPDHKDYVSIMEVFAPIRAAYPPLTVQKINTQNNKSNKFLKGYLKPKAAKKHLHNHKEYQFYDES